MDFLAAHAEHASANRSASIKSACSASTPKSRLRSVSMGPSNGMAKRRQGVAPGDVIDRKTHTESPGILREALCVIQPLLNRECDVPWQPAEGQLALTERYTIDYRGLNRAQPLRAQACWHQLTVPRNRCPGKVEPSRVQLLVFLRSHFHCFATLAVLVAPAVFAPILVRSGGRVPARLHQICAMILRVIPMAAPWLLARDASPLVVWLVTIAGGIVMLKTIDWLARPRQLGARLRVWLALTIWPALQIEDVAVPLARLKDRIEQSLKRFAAGSLSVVCGLALAALGQHLGIPARRRFARQHVENGRDLPAGRWVKPSPGRVVCIGGVSPPRRLPLSDPGAFGPRLLGPVQCDDSPLAQAEHLRADRHQTAQARTGHPGRFRDERAPSRVPLPARRSQCAGMATRLLPDTRPGCDRWRRRRAYVQTHHRPPHAARLAIAATLVSIILSALRVHPLPRSGHRPASRVGACVLRVIESTIPAWRTSSG